MKIAKYIGDLLYDYECVVIPGLGGFLTDDKSSSINEVTFSFSPPFRKIHFNVYLRTNDGLLVNHVAQQEQIGYKTAKQKVDQFVFQCHNALETGRKIKFQNIGSLSYDSEKNIVFAQDIKVNYSSNSFGLSSVVSPAIRRVTDEEKVRKVVKSAFEKSKIRKKPEDRKVKIEKKVKPAVGKKMHAKRRKSSLSNQLTVLLVIFLAMGAGIMYLQREALADYFDKHSSHIPFFYSSVNDYLADNITSGHVAELSRSTASFFPFFLDQEDSTVIEEDSDPVNMVMDNTVEIIEEENTNDESIESETNESETKELPIILNDKPVELDDNSGPKESIESPKIKEANPKEVIHSSDRFFIIAGSFSDESNARRLVNQLVSKGYNALIADTNKYGMFRVAVMKFSNRIAAENELLAIRNEENPKAWILVK